MSKSDKWGSVCRACLSVSNDFFPIFETEQLGISPVSMLQNLSLELSDNVDLPRNLCHSCYTKLRIGNDFVEIFKKSQETLQNSLDTIQTQFEEFGNDTESFIIECEDGSRKNKQYDSDDQDYLIKRSVELTQQYKNNKWNGDSDSDNCSIDSETVDSDHATEPAEEKKSCSRTTVLSCPVCPKTFKRFTLFRSHLHSHSGQINCGPCSRQFHDTEEYINHYQMKHRFQCNICQKSFLSRGSYSKHKYTHSNATPRFNCPISDCPKVFSIKQSLHNHVATIHSERRNFLCNICGASFKNHDNLRYHMKKHTGAPHLCTYCGRTFMQAGHLKYHMWKHTGVKPYKCGKCHKGFVSKWVLTMHVKKNCGQV
ncbi:Zinc finger protein 569-like Protein [Tribolium castaneum]|uniref:Zinc finger protein 569-like Protein n=1 Tax=Tribolium castaneum TaxID=7070 RepID=D6WKA2_TRICA|nr:PREDICTED: zinc finger protein 665 [Tribolium castaneum]EFA03610.1 Zinc finger protein 569-like Protein [Tribolium castaneum]|eukprot:XP_008193247.2 PREDICTED: zinc finger protein 665 [Tribolium castaneum]